ncbi:MAG: porin, partial [Nitrospirae bacterium]|nr:porin [Nitrospirota bacterium]
MIKRYVSISVLLMMVFTFSASVFAEEKAEEKKAALSAEDIKNALGMSIYLQGGYTYNFENPASKENGLRVFDQQANSFLLDLAQIQFLKEPAVGGVGFKLKLSVGETAKFIHSAGLGDSKDVFDLTEAYVSYTAPLGKGDSGFLTS